MANARMNGEIQAFEHGVAEQLAELHNKVMYQKWRVQTYENLFVRPRFGILRALILSIFRPAVMQRRVEKEFGRIIDAHRKGAQDMLAKLVEREAAERKEREAREATERARARILTPSGLPAGVVARIGNG